MRTFEEGDYVTGFEAFGGSAKGTIRYVCKNYYHIDRDDKVGGSGIWYNGVKLWAVRKKATTLRLVGDEDLEEAFATASSVIDKHFDKIAMDALDDYEKSVEGSFEYKTTLPVSSEERKEHPVYSGPIKYFPAALAYVAKVCKLGNDKHNPGQPLHHAREKSGDHEDCIIRHLIDLSEDYGCGVGRDEKGVAQVDYIAWRALALAQEWHEKNDGSPLAPGASKGE